MQKKLLAMKRGGLLFLAVAMLSSSFAYAYTGAASLSVRREVAEAPVEEAVETARSAESDEFAGSGALKELEEAGSENEGADESKSEAARSTEAREEDGSEGRTDEVVETAEEIAEENTGGSEVQREEEADDTDNADSDTDEEASGLPASDDDQMESEIEADTEEEGVASSDGVLDVASDGAIEMSSDGNESMKTVPDGEEDTTSDGAAEAALAAATSARASDFTYEASNGGVVITGYTGTSKDLDIPSTINGGVVWKIEEYAFSDMSDLESATIPSTVTTLGRGAFRNCTGLTEVTIHAESLPDASPYSAVAHDEEGNDAADYAVFYNAGAMSGMEVTFGEGVTRIPAYLFATGSGRTEGVYCKISAVSIPDSVTSIGEYAFYLCYGLQDLTVGSGAESIGAYAFASTAVRSCGVAEGLKSIGECAFADAGSLGSVVIPSTVTSLGKGAFRNCVSLTEVAFNAKNLPDASSYCKVANDYYSNDDAHFAVFYNAGAMSGMTVTFGEEVTRIPAYLFATGNAEAASVYCRVSQVSISDSVRTIGEYAFYRCYGLQEVGMGSRVTSIGSSAFEACNELQEMALGNKVISIGDSAFASTGLRSLRLSEGIRTIGEYAFCNVGGISSLVIPSTVTSLGKGAFKNCTGLATLTINAANLADASFFSALPYDYYGNYDVNFSVFYNAGSADGMTVAFGSKVTRIPAYLFATGNDESTDVFCKVSTVSVSASVTEIGAYAFCNCYWLTSLTLQGDRPVFGSSCFLNDTLTVHYSYVEAWPSTVLLDYGGTVTWTGEVLKFSDVPSGSWYFDKVYWAVERGVTAGTTSSTFSPHKECTRAEIVTFIWSDAGKPEPTRGNTFRDVGSTWYTKAVVWAAENGIAAGNTAREFDPSGSCTRGQAVTFIAAYKLWEQKKKLSSYRPTIESPFEDVEESKWYTNAVLWAVENGVTAGTTATTFQPNKSCTRAEIVTFLYAAASHPSDEDGDGEA